jgi:hypothetical protein
MDFQPSWAMKQTIETGIAPDCEDGITIEVEDWQRAILTRNNGKIYGEIPNDDFFMETTGSCITIYNKKFNDGGIRVGYIDKKHATINPMYVDYQNANWR